MLGPESKTVWISNAKRAASEPTACIDKSDRLWTAWVSCNRTKQTTARIDGACLVDGKVVAEFALEDAGVFPAAPYLAVWKQDVYLVWEAGGDGERHLLGRELRLSTGDSNVELGLLERIPTGKGTPLVPQLASTDKSLFLVYQGLNESDYDLFLGQRSEQGWSAPTLLSDTDVDEWNPKLAADRSGGLHLVWDFFDGQSFDVAYARIEKGKLANERLIASGAEYQGFPEMAVGDDNSLWIAWESSSQFGEYGGLRAERELRLAKLSATQAGTKPAIQFARTEDLSSEIKRREFPRPTLTDRGLFLTYSSPVRANRKRDHLFTAWKTSVVEFGSKGIAEQSVPLSDGNSDAESVLVSDAKGKLWLVFIADRRSEQFARVTAWSDAIERRPRLAVTPVEAKAGFPALGETPPETSRDSSKPIPSATRPTAKALPGIVFGDLHRHTHLSRCSGAKDGTLLDAYRYARGPGGLGFVAITDHFQHMRAWSWFRSRRDAIRYNAPGSLVVLSGVERVRAKRGHYNDIYFDPEEVPFDTETWLKAPARFAPAKPEHVIAIPHMMSIDDGTGFNWDEFEADRTRLFEIYQGKRGSFEGRGLPYESDDGVEHEIALARGFERGAHFGLIAASDHVSSSTSYTGLHVESLTRSSVFEALRQRRCYATTVARPIESTLGKLAMGQAGDPGANARFAVELPGESHKELAYIELVKNGVTHKRLAGEGENENWIITFRRGPQTSMGALAVQIEGGKFDAANSRRPGSPGLRIESVEDQLVKFRRTDFIQIDVQIAMNWEPGAATQQLVFKSGDVEVIVPRRSIELGNSFTINQAGLVALAWRQGSPLKLSESSVQFAIDVQTGDSYYARVAWLDGNLAWTSPIRIDERGADQ
ncbi:MAG: hypothetical protein ACI8TQ_001971 [Planctomycetota bacterium]|jgi:hypothetical protein